MTPKFEFMLAKLGDSDVFNRKSLAGFIFEPKFDGTRVLVYKDGDDIELVNRKGEDIIRKYLELLDVPNNVKARACVLDGVIVILDSESKPSLSLLQEREQLSGQAKIKTHAKKNPATLFIFDILFKDSADLTSLPLEKRKQELQKTVVESSFMKICPYTSNGKELWERIGQTAVDAVIAKDLGSKYEQNKRTWSWLKIKKNETIDAIIAGYIKNKEEKYFSSIILSCFSAGEPIIVGKIDEFDEETSKKLTKMIKKLAIKEKHFLSEGERNKFKDAFWLKPEIIAELKISGLKEKQLVEPRLLRLRFDKKPEDCVIE